MSPSDRTVPETRSVPAEFDSFDIEIERLGDAYRAQVTSSPVGPTRSPVAIDPVRLSAEAPASRGKGARARDVRRRPSASPGDLKRIGERLFRAVFSGGIAEAYRASVERARAQRHGLRLRLRLDAAPELAPLPWEALWDPTVRAFLADQPDLPVVRALGVATLPARAQASPPLRLLALLPEPRGESKLSGNAEWERITEHLDEVVGHGLIRAEKVEPATLEGLGRSVADHPCHVLHIVAHGGPGDAGAGGLLKLEDAAGGVDAVSGGDLARALEHRSPPRLVVVSACHGARSASDDAFDGLAQHLLSRGIPAVVAMRTAISDDAAVEFAAALYRELARGRTVEAAVAAARRELSLGKHRTEWATPVLYLNGENVRVFETEIPMDLDRGSHRPRRIAGAAGALAAAAVLASVFLWPAEDPGPCPPLPGLADLRFVLIDAGVVDLGERKVIVEEAFCIGTREVSRRDWLAVMGGEAPRGEWPATWPMTDVTAADAEAFARQLGARDPDGIFALPTEAQWELAARAGRSTDYFFGDDPADLYRYGNCRSFLARDGYDGPAPTGSFEPNPLGLYDVHGNVAEWVRWPASEGPAVDSGGEALALRRGGSYDNVPRNCGFRDSRSIVKAEIGNRPDTGFRVVRLLTAPREPPVVGSKATN